MSRFWIQVDKFCQKWQTFFKLSYFEASFTNVEYADMLLLIEECRWTMGPQEDSGRQMVFGFYA